MNAEQIDALIDYVRAAVRLAVAEPLQKDAMTSLPSLLPCPFCGGAAELDTRQGYSALGTGRMGTRIAVYCLECSADIGICREDVPDVEPEHVIEQWNRRAALSTSTGQAEPTADAKDAAGSAELTAMRWLWDDQSLEEKQNYLRAAARAALSKGDSK